MCKYIICKFRSTEGRDERKVNTQNDDRNKGKIAVGFEREKRSKKEGRRKRVV
jgi:hypothetical protein